MLGELEQALEPAFHVCAAAGEEVIAAPAGGDLKPAVAPDTGGKLDRPLVCACSIPSCSARWRSGASSPANTRPSASRIRQRNPSRWLLARSGGRAAVAAGIGSSLLRYGPGRVSPRWAP